LIERRFIESRKAAAAENRKNKKVSFSLFVDKSRFGTAATAFRDTNHVGGDVRVSRALRAFARASR
jgi:hypothetical protein